MIRVELRPEDHEAAQALQRLVAELPDDPAVLRDAEIVVRWLGAVVGSRALMLSHPTAPIDLRALGVVE